MTYLQLNTNSSFGDQDMNEYRCNRLWNWKCLYGLVQVPRNSPLNKQNKSTPLFKTQPKEDSNKQNALEKLKQQNKMTNIHIET